MNKQVCVWGRVATLCITNFTRITWPFSQLIRRTYLKSWHKYIEYTCHLYYYYSIYTDMLLSINTFKHNNIAYKNLLLHYINTKKYKNLAPLKLQHKNLNTPILKHPAPQLIETLNTKPGHNPYFASFSILFLHGFFI